MQELQRQLDALAARLARLEPVDVPRAIGAIYASDSGQSIPTGGAGTVVNYEDLVYDPDSLVTVGASWVFTVPVAGLYSVAAHVLYAATTTWAATEAARLSVAVNGNIVRHVCRQTDFTAASILVWTGGATLVSCAVGDTIDVRALQNSGAGLALQADAAFNHVSIWKVG